MSAMDENSTDHPRPAESGRRWRGLGVLLALLVIGGLWRLVFAVTGLRYWNAPSSGQRLPRPPAADLHLPPPTLAVDAARVAPEDQ